MNTYTYSGPVMEFDRCIASTWHGETTAQTTAKARSNLTYQFKKQNNRVPGCRISLPGPITKVEQEVTHSGRL